MSRVESVADSSDAAAYSNPSIGNHPSTRTIVRLNQVVCGSTV